MTETVWGNVSLKMWRLCLNLLNNFGMLSSLLLTPLPFLWSYSSSFVEIKTPEASVQYCALTRDLFLSKLLQQHLARLKFNTRLKNTLCSQKVEYCPRPFALPSHPFMINTLSSNFFLFLCMCICVSVCIFHYMSVFISHPSGGWHIQCVIQYGCHSWDLIKVEAWIK